MQHKWKEIIDIVEKQSNENHRGSTPDVEAH
jgi:hypothetical protein